MPSPVTSPDVPCAGPGSEPLAVVCVLTSTLDSALGSTRAEMATFISVPLKKSSEVDLVKPLSKFVNATYQASDEQGEYIRAVEELNKLRKSAVGRPLDKHESSLELLLRYTILHFMTGLRESAKLETSEQLLPTLTFVIAAPRCVSFRLLTGELKFEKLRS